MMKWIISTLLLTSLLFCADIDVNLYEGDNTEAYYQKIEDQIEAASTSKLYPEPIIQEEKLYLSRVRSAASQILQVESNYIQTFDENTSIELDHYYSVLTETASLRLSMNERHEIYDDIQSKLAHTRKVIHNLVEDNKQKLLIYQLQYAYYKLQQKNLETKLDLLQKHEAQILQMLTQSLSRVVCDKMKSLETELLANENEIEKIFQDKITVQIDLEKALIEESAKINHLKEKVNLSNSKYQKALTRKLVLHIQKSLCLLKKRQNKEFFNLLDDITTIIKSISKEERPSYTEQVNILMQIAKKEFGSTKLFFGSTLHESRDLLSKARESFSTPLFVYNEQPISLFSLLKALLFVILGFFAGKLYKRWIVRMSFKWPNMSQMSIRLASNIGYYLIVFITLIIAVGSLGINMTSISLIAGALSIGIGFGLQTVVSNLIAGIILMFERTIRIGDTVEISDMLRGRVTDMRIRSTTIKTFDNVDIVVPNSSFIQNNVINWTLEDLTRRLHIPFGVAYGTEIKDVIRVVLEELEQSDLKYIRHDSTKSPEVWMTNMNNSSVDFELLVWIEWDNKLRPNSFRSDFLILIYNALNKNGIQIPFPQLDLHVKHMPSELPK
jgi:potassium-dependent mechanosensitive channel